MTNDQRLMTNDQKLSPNHGYEKLDVWQRSMELVVDVYKAVKSLPKEETYALSDQIRRSAVSIPSNIAEGASRNSKKEFLQFLYVALGSAAELETQFLIAERIGYLSDAVTTKNQIVIVKKMLNSLITATKRRI